MSAMLFLLPLLLCGVHSKHFLIETQDTDEQTTDETEDNAGNGPTNYSYDNEGKMPNYINTVQYNNFQGHY